MSDSPIISILKQHDLRITNCRQAVLSTFLSASGALSTPELETSLSEFDRVTLYRTLHSFTEKGILHIIPDDSGAARYGICHETCSPEEHQHNHVHFKCDDCGIISCLTDQHIPKIAVPGYKIVDVNMILRGLCQSCNIA